MFSMDHQKGTLYVRSNDGEESELDFIDIEEEVVEQHEVDGEVRTMSIHYPKSITFRVKLHVFPLLNNEIKQNLEYYEYLRYNDYFKRRVRSYPRRFERRKFR